MAFHFFKNFLNKGQPKEISIEQLIDEKAVGELCATEYYLAVAISMIAAVFSKCTFRTCLNGKERKGEDYYRWNIEPNRNESGTELKKKIVEKLLRENECLIIEVGGRLYAADSYYISKDNPLEEKVFSGVTVENQLIRRDFKMSQVIYIKNNNKDIRALINGVTEGYKRIAQQAAEDYEKANGHKGTLNIDTIAIGKQYGDKSFSEVYEDLVNNRFKRYFNNKNAVLPLFEGFHYTEQAVKEQSKSEDKPADYDRMIQGVAGKVALAFHMSPKILTGDVEGMNDAVSMLLSFCIDPLKKTIESAINKTMYGKEVLKDCYMWVDTSTILHIDLFAMAEKVDKIVASGIYCIDETREKAGDLPLNTPESRQHFMTKNYEKLEEIQKGGKESGKTDDDTTGGAADTASPDDAAQATGTS